MNSYESRTSDLSMDDSETRYENPEEEQHPPLSPKSSAESLFFGGLETSNISANALAHQIRVNHKEGSGALSIITDDFASAVESTADFDEDDRRDVAEFAPNTPTASILEHDENEYEQLTDFSSPTDTSDTNTDTMAKKSKTSTVTDTAASAVDAVKDAMPTKTADTYVQVVGAPKGTKVKKDAPLTPARNTSPPDQANAASHVYEHAKGIWAWGKGVPVFSPFMGLAEGIASKAVGVVGTNLEEIDGNIKPQLTNLDNGLLNPIIGKVAGIVLGAVVKTEDIIKPIIIRLLNPFGMIEDDSSTTPEVTVTAN